MSIFRLAAASGNYAAWDLSLAEYSGNSFTASNTLNVNDVFFKTDGSRVYFPAVDAGDSIYRVTQADLSTPWDITTASGTGSLSLGATAEFTAESLFIKPDGLKLYVLTSFGTNAVYEYDLSTPWDITTATLNEDDGGVILGSEGISFKPDGTKVYVSSITADSIYEYNLSSAWDIATASLVQSESISSALGLYFRSDGNRLYSCEVSTVHEYDLTTSWDISTLNLVQSFSVASQGNRSEGVSFKPDGRIMYVADQTGDIYQYNLI